MFLYLSFNIPGLKIFQNENLGENFIHFIISEQDGNLDHNFLGMGKTKMSHEKRALGRNTCGASSALTP